MLFPMNDEMRWIDCAVIADVTLKKFGRARLVVSLIEMKVEKTSTRERLVTSIAVEGFDVLVDLKNKASFTDSR